MNFIKTIGRRFGTEQVTVIHAEGTADEQRHQLEAQIQADSGFFDVDAPIYEQDIVEVPDPRGGTRRLFVAKVDINKASAAMQNMSHIQAHWGKGSPPPPPPPKRRRLMVFLFTDIVASTERAREIGDQQWAQVLTDHHETVRSHLEAHGGTEVDTAGDGFFATFEGVAEALSCALSALEALNTKGVKVRAGVHVGEAEPAEKPTGLAVHAAARIMSSAEEGTVFVSNLVRELLRDDSRFEFDDRGEHELKGVGTTWLARARWRS